MLVKILINCLRNSSLVDLNKPFIQEWTTYALQKPIIALESTVFKFVAITMAQYNFYGRRNM